MSDELLETSHCEHLEEDHLIRLHEKTMDSHDRRILVVEKKINQIPWILLAAILNIGLTLFVIVSNFFLKSHL